MTDKKIGCVTHDCDKCAERDTLKDEAEMHARVAQHAIDDVVTLKAEIADAKIALDVQAGSIEAVQAANERLAAKLAEMEAQIPIGRIAGKLITRATFTVGPNEGSTLFSKLCRELLIEGLTFHDTRGTALTHLSKKVDVLTLAKISRHKDLSLLSNVYYRATADSIARLI